jgi:hypothetical protein
MRIFARDNMVKYTLSSIKGSKEQLHSWSYQLLLRYPTMVITWILANFTSISPNAVSFLGIIPNVISGYYFAKESLLLGS